jgi:hypothetical protein
MPLRDIIAAAIWDAPQHSMPGWCRLRADRVIEALAAAGYSLPADPTPPTPSAAESERRRPDEGETQRMLRQLEQTMTMDFQTLQSKVAAQTTVIQSNNTLLSELSQELRDMAAAGTVTADQLQQLADGIDANSTSLSQAVVANTPAAGGGGTGGGGTTTGA